MSKRTMHVVRKAWSEHELATLRTLYPHSTGSALEAELGRSAKSIYSKAHEIGLQKSAEYLASQRSSRIKRGKQHPNMVATQFRPGHATWNKGIKGSTGLHPNCRATQFVPRAPDEARNYLPIGSLRINTDGYLERKVTDDRSIATARRWVGVHRLVWEAAHGPIPEGRIVVFAGGRRTTNIDEITLDRLECISRAEHARRNSHWRNPELGRLTQLKGAITRQVNRIINERKQAHEQPTEHHRTARAPDGVPGKPARPRQPHGA